MGVHCYLTELGALVTMAAKIVAVVAALATVVAGEPGYGYGGVAYHSYGGSSYTHRSPQGLHGGYGYHGYGKRSAEAEPGYGYGHAVSYTHRSPQGLHGHYGGYGYGGYYGKRSAEPGYYGGASSFVHQSRPYYHGSYGYGINHYGK